ncbi:MAG: hypothetical protein HFG29_06285 [Eubacterium sp.]|nr:hypothetical protein [Eubacterium sp.]
MPFFQPVVHSDNLLGCGSLRVQRPKTNRKMEKTKMSQGKRVYLFTSVGSITLEAAIVTTMFLLIAFSILGYMSLLNKQLSYQIKVNNAAVAMAKFKFYKETVSKITNYQQYTTKLEEEINFNKLNVRENQSDVIDIISDFVYQVPWIGKRIKITERCRVKDWTGHDITKQQKLVYITKNGKVYHVTKECSHLSLSIRKINYSQLDEERNCYGGKYKRCAICIGNKQTLATDIFVTEDGDKYHCSLMCSGLLRNIIIIDKSEVGNRKPCSRCSGG